MLPLHDNQPLLQAAVRSASVASVSPAVDTSRPSVDTTDGVTLPKPLKAFPPFHEMRTAVKTLDATEGTDSSARQGASALSGFSKSRSGAAAQCLPSTLTVAATGLIASELMLTKPATMGEEPSAVEVGFKTLRSAIDIVAQNLGLQRISPQELGDQPFAGLASTIFTSFRSDHLLVVWTDAKASDLSMEELSEAASVRIATESILRDGISALATEHGMRRAAEELGRRLRRDAPLLLTALSQAGLLRNDTVNETGSAHRTPRLIAKQLGIILQSLEGVLRSVVRNGGGPGAIATTLAQFYATLTTPMVTFAAAAPLSFEEAPANARSPLIAIPVERQTASKTDNSTPDALAVLRALAAREAIATTEHDMALLSADMERLLSHHRRGLELLRETRGFLSAVRLTESDARRRQPLGVLLENGRHSASAIAAGGRSALISVLTVIGTSDGAVLDRLAQAAKRDGSKSLVSLIADLGDADEEEKLDGPLTGLNSTTLSAIVSETRAAARLLRAMLFRETTAAAALAAQIDAVESSR